jgi:Cu/Ag efflux pump CusA
MGEMSIERKLAFFALLCLGALASRAPEIKQNQTEIHRENLRNMSAVTARLEGRDLGSAMKKIKARVLKEVSLPPETVVNFDSVDLYRSGFRIQGLR